LGSAARGGVPLAKAREKATAARALLQDGINPLEEKRAAGRANIAVPTFGAFADQYVEAMKPSWRNSKHAAQWAMTLQTYAEPIRARPIDAIDTEAVLEVLKPLWQRVPETAERLRGRIENVLHAARVRGHRTGDNPAQWRGHLDQLLPKRQRLTRGHHAAMPYDKLPAFMVALRARESLASLAMEFAILTACRTGEVLGARWEEFDLEKAEWTIPASRMKAGKPHRVPLSVRALVIIEGLAETLQGDFLFPGGRAGKPLSSMAMAMQLRRMKVEGVTVHGFRSAFRDWAAETTSFPHEVCEMALAHVIGNKAEAAYRRGDMFDRRRKLMEAWAMHCEPREAGSVVPLHTVAKGAA
jgi:integrase